MTDFFRVLKKVWEIIIKKKHSLYKHILSHIFYCVHGVWNVDVSYYTKRVTLKIKHCVHVYSGHFRFIVVNVNKHKIYVPSFYTQNLFSPSECVEYFNFNLSRLGK